MSAINTLLAGGERLLLACGHGDTFSVLTGAAAGKSFIARLDTVQVIDVESDLGPDPRMQDVIRILSPVPALGAEDLVQCIGGAKLKILKRENNAASITTDYWVEQQI